MDNEAENQTEEEFCEKQPEKFENVFDTSINALDDDENQAGFIEDI